MNNYAPFAWLGSECTIELHWSRNVFLAGRLYSFFRS